jgi:integrase
VATVRERQTGVWEIRVFTGRDADGRPTQISKTVRGTKRDAKRVAAQLESQPNSTAAGRTVTDVLDAWREVNEGVWSASSKRDYASRAAYVENDSIGRVAIARLSVADVERWHSRLRRSGVGESAIRSRHSVLRAALAQAVRWGWVGTNVAAAARLRHGKRQPCESMTADEVRAVIAAADSIDPAAGLALRLAAIAGARRSEIAALRWDDFNAQTGRLRIDSTITVIRDGERGTPTLLDAPTKTADRRLVFLDPATVDAFQKQRAEREEIGPYLFSLTLDPPNPDRIGWWWQRSRALSGIDRKWRLHDLRHWTATTAITSGHDVRTVAGRLGHANAAMTLRVYAHAVEAADEQLAQTLGAALADE